MIEAITHADSYRRNTEDRVAIFPTGDGYVVVIADGMGGRSGGADAAQAFVDFVRQELPTLTRLNAERTWLQILQRADLVILQNALAGETTAVALYVDDFGIAGASVGDSGAWLITPRDWHDLTANQIRKPGLGTGMARPSCFCGTMTGVLLVATDGLLKYTSPQVICDRVRQDAFSALAASLVDAVRLRSGTLQDDIAVALCRKV